ncbi:hypothetical protein GCM10023192_16000 [Amycolatopsis samaneae]
MDPRLTFAEHLRELRVLVGEPSYRELEVCASRLPGARLARATISDLLSGRASRWPTVESFVLACERYAKDKRAGVPPESFDLARWRADFDATRRLEADLGGGPLREPYRPADSAETPVRLLRAEYALVPFQARDELTVLLEWCRQVVEGDRTGIAVVDGIGGAGKTRLVLELANRFRQEGWYSGVLPKGADPTSLTTVSTPLLVVVDYADGRVSEVTNLLKLLRAGRDRPSVVVLTARSAAGQWFTDIVGALDDDRHSYRREEITLPDEHPSTTDIFLRTIAALAPNGRVSIPLTPSTAIRWTTLDLVLLGWIAASGVTTLPTTQTELYDEALRHEENYWCKVYTELAGRTPDRRLLRTAAACVSLVAADEKQAGRVLTAIDDLNDDPTERRLIRRTLQTCLNPASGEGLAVRPDPIGDHLLLSELARDESLLHATLAHAGEQRTDTAIAILDRAGQREPATTVPMITAILDAEPTRWRAAFAVAIRQPGPALTALCDVVSRPSTAIPLDSLSAELPFRTMPMYELGLIVDKTRLDDARRNGAPRHIVAELLAQVAERARYAGDPVTGFAAITEAVGHYRELVITEPAGYERDLAMSLERQAVFQVQLGHPQEALTTTKEAVSRYRLMARTELGTGLPQLASGVASLANRLLALGRHEDALAAAEEAVDLHQRLTTPDSTFRRRERARAWSILGATRSVMGIHQKALDATEEAVTLYRQLAADDPAGFLADLAGSLANLGVQLSDVDRLGEALNVAVEAVHIHEYLADANPAVHLPDLAAALTNLGHRLSEVDIREALAVVTKAVDIYRRLAGSGRAGHGAHFAASLISLSKCQMAAKQWEEALETAQEAAESCRQLFIMNPDAHIRNLAMATLTLSLALMCTNNYEKALEAAEEAVTLHRRLAAANRVAHLNGLANALNALKSARLNLGRHGEALEAAEETLDLYRRLIRLDPARHQRHLADSMFSVSRLLSATERRDEEFAAGEEATALYRRLAEENPTLDDLSKFGAALISFSLSLVGQGQWRRAHQCVVEAVDLFEHLTDVNSARHLPDLARARDLLGAIQTNLGWFDDGLASAKNAVGLYRKLADADRNAYLPGLAASLHNLGAIYSGMDRRQEALLAAEEAVQLYQELTADDVLAYLPQFPNALSGLSNVLSALERREEALLAVEEAVALYEQLDELSRVRISPEWAGSLITLGGRLEAVGRHQEAVAATEQGVAIQRRLAEENPIAHLSKLADSLNNFGVYLSRVDRPHDATAAMSESVALYRQLTEADPVAHLPRFCVVLNTLSKQFDVDENDEAAGKVWDDAINAVPPGPARAELRTALARRWAAADHTEAALEQVFRAVAEVDDPALDTADAAAHAFRVRQSIRGVVIEYGMISDALPTWAVRPIPRAQLELCDAMETVEDWITARKLLCEYKEVFDDVEFAANVEIIAALRSSTSIESKLGVPLKVIARDGFDAYVADQDARHAEHELLKSWLAMPSRDDFARFYRTHWDALSRDSCQRRLATFDDPATPVGLAVLALGTTLSPDDVLAIVTDSATATDAAFQAIETGHLGRLWAIAETAPELRATPTTWGLIVVGHLLEQGRPDAAMDVGRQLAELGTPIVRRAHAARLRALLKCRPELAELPELINIIDHTPSG